MAFVDIRDRYGITQLAFNEAYSKELLEKASTLGREFVIQATGKVAERSAKNGQLETGDIQIIVESLTILNDDVYPLTLPVVVTGEIFCVFHFTKGL